MNDHGIGAAVRTGLRFFIAACRSTGRTTDMLRSARPGDIIITASTREANRLRRLLRDMGKGSAVEVTYAPPLTYPDMLRRRGTNPNGATTFDHTWIEAYWEMQVERIGDELVGMQKSLSKVPLPEPRQTKLEQRLFDMEHRR